MPKSCKTEYSIVKYSETLPLATFWIKIRGIKPRLESRVQSGPILIIHRQSNGLPFKPFYDYMLTEDVVMLKFKPLRS